MSKTIDSDFTLETFALFPPSFFLENLAVRPDGSILVTALNQGELWCVPSTTGKLPVTPVLVDTLDSLPMGIVEVEPDVFYVCTVGEAALERYDMRGWTPGATVKRERVFTFPTSASGLNGTCLLGPNVLLIADSTAGLIWRVDLADGGRSAKATVWLRDNTMAAGWDLPQVVLTPKVTIPYPGVNGVRFAAKRNYLYYTGCAQQLFVRVAVDPDTLNAVGTPAVIESGILSADDFCIDEAAGVGYIGTHVANTIRRVSLTPTESPWRDIVAGGLIFCQLWHAGRISHPSLQPGGALPVAPSAVKSEAQAFTEHGFEPCVTPRALERDEIPGVIEQYRRATDCARRAGFDGVEILGGGGYLVDQFLKDKTNLRTDDYGGSIPNRVRFMTEVVEAVVGAWSADRVGIKLATGNPVNDIADSNPEPLFFHVLEQLNFFNLGHLLVVEGETLGSREMTNGIDPQKLRRLFSGLYIANNSYDLEAALKARRETLADLVAFGRPFISNPDLVERLRIGAPLVEPDRTTFYGGAAHGHTDYPALPKAAD
jgi:N-ethylmaleimide reductase